MLSPIDDEREPIPSLPAQLHALSRAIFIFLNAMECQWANVARCAMFANAQHDAPLLCSRCIKREPKYCGRNDARERGPGVMQQISLGGTLSPTEGGRFHNPLSVCGFTRKN
jgi:hypothetical protein